MESTVLIARINSSMSPVLAGARLACAFILSVSFLFGPFLQAQAQQALPANKSDNKLQGKIEKLGGDGRITRPMPRQKSELQLNSGAGIFTPSNFDLSVKKSPTSNPLLKPILTPAEEQLKKEANASLPNLTATARPKGLEALKNLDVFFLIDCSGSMTVPDCPSKTPEVPLISRWQWTGDEIKKFSSETHEILQQGITIILYNHTAQRKDNCHEKELSEIFENNYPYGDTRLAHPLREALSKQLLNSRPSFIVVIGDGAASDQQDVEHELFLASAEPGAEKKIKILMTQVGEDPDSHVYQGSVSSVSSFSGKDPIIKYVPFRDLKANGFGKIIESMLTSH